MPRRVLEFPWISEATVRSSTICSILHIFQLDFSNYLEKFDSASKCGNIDRIEIMSIMFGNHQKSSILFLQLLSFLERRIRVRVLPAVPDFKAKGTFYNILITYSNYRLSRRVLRQSTLQEFREN